MVTPPPFWPLILRPSGNFMTAFDPTFSSNTFSLWKFGYMLIRKWCNNFFELHKFWCKKLPLVDFLKISYTKTKAYFQDIYHGPLLPSLTILVRRSRFRECEKGGGTFEASPPSQEIFCGLNWDPILLCYEFRAHIQKKACHLKKIKWDFTISKSCGEDGD